MSPALQLRARGKLREALELYNSALALPSGKPSKDSSKVWLPD